MLSAEDLPGWIFVIPKAILPSRVIPVGRLIPATGGRWLISNTPAVLKINIALRNISIVPGLYAMTEPGTLIFITVPRLSACCVCIG